MQRCRISNLEGPFRVWVTLKKLMKREGRQPDDMNATGGSTEEEYFLTNRILVFITTC